MIAITCALVDVACSSGVSETAPATTTTDATTTTSTTEPLSIEEQVEEASLYAWEVYAGAVSELDESQLHEAYTGRALEIVTNEVKERQRDRRPARVDVDHSFIVTVIDEETAVVVDDYINHQVLVDPGSGEPIEPDPDETIVEAYSLSLLDGQWFVAEIERR